MITTRFIGSYLLSFPDAEYVLRRPPLGPIAPGAHDMFRQYRVLSRLWQHFPQHREPTCCVMTSQ